MQFLHIDNEDSDQTGFNLLWAHMLEGTFYHVVAMGRYILGDFLIRLNLVFTVRTCQKVRFLMLRRMGIDILGGFSVIFTYTCSLLHFLFTFLHTSPLLKRDLPYKERLCFQRGANGFFYVYLFAEGKKNAFNRVVSPKSVNISLKQYMTHS